MTKYKNKDGQREREKQRTPNRIEIEKRPKHETLHSYFCPW